MSTSNYIPTIGLEIHAHLDTKTKMFCSCPNHFGDQPNANVCPVCLGMPGVLPVPNIEGIKKAILAGLALNCSIPSFTKWDRKHYFYPDLPKGFQISQYDLPLCKEGYLDIMLDDGAIKRIGITRAHLEEDAGKLVHSAYDYSLVDLNRAGTPLLEIVSKPDISSPVEAVTYAKQIKNILSWIGVNSGNLEEGVLRFDINVSVRPEGQKELGTKVEIKNLNSFRALQKALEHEIERQVEDLKQGKKIEQDTRLWDPDKEVSRSMRSKENAHDYRYFPEPDIPPYTPSEEFVEDLRKQLPILPEEARKKLKEKYLLSDIDAHVLISDRTIFELFNKTFTISQKNSLFKSKDDAALAKNIANWFSGKFLNLLKEHALEPSGSKLTPEHIVEVLELLEESKISSTVAKEVFEQAFLTGDFPKKIVEQKGLTQISDQGEIDGIVKNIIDKNPVVVESIQKGKMGAIGFLVGQIMKETKGKANPNLVNDLIKKHLGV